MQGERSYDRDIEHTAIQYSYPCAPYSMRFRLIRDSPPAVAAPWPTSYDRTYLDNRPPMSQQFEPITRDKSFDLPRRYPTRIQRHHQMTEFEQPSVELWMLTSTGLYGSRVCVCMRRVLERRRGSKAGTRVNSLRCQARGICVDVGR